RHTPMSVPEIYGDGIDQDCDGYDRPSITCPLGALRVPGDYATITDAIVAIQSGTTPSHEICLGARRYSESIRTQLTRFTVWIHGLNAQATTIDGHVDISAAAGVHPSLIIEGLTITQGIQTYNPDLYLQDCVVRGRTTESAVSAGGEG